MARRYRLGVIGFAHMHVNELVRQFSATDRVEWVACADTVPDVRELVEAPNTRAWNLRYARDEFGISKVYADYDEMLDREELDLVLVCSEVAKHADLAEAIAARGANVMIDKPMAASLADALRITRATAAAGVELFVNWPTTWYPPAAKAKQLIDEGAIGEVWEVKIRLGLDGPLSHNVPNPRGEPVSIDDTQKGATWWYQTGTGGGVMLDEVCYGACLSRWYVGQQARAAFGMKANLRSHFGSVEDNAAIMVSFPRAMAIVEATWSCVDNGTPWLLVYGDTGTIAAEFYDPKQAVRVLRGPGRDPVVVESGTLPSDRDDLAKELIHHLDTGEPVHQTLRPGFNLEAMAILDAGIRSASSGKLELVDDVSWCVG